MHIEGVGAVTNKSFYCAYRGYGKDKGIKFIEHALNQIARKLGMTPEAIRLKITSSPTNFPIIRSTAMSTTAAITQVP